MSPAPRKAKPAPGRGKAPFKVLLVTEKKDYVPLGFGYIKAYADRELKGAVDIEIFYPDSYYDLFRPGPAREKVLEAGLVGFTCFHALDPFAEMAFHLKRMRKDLRVVVGGPGVTTSAAPGLKLKSGIDYLVIGEGEETFAELLRHLLSGRPEPGAIKGLALPGPGGLAVNPKREPIRDLDALPSPYLGGIFDISKFSEFAIDSSRGCLFSCAYCGQSKFMTAYRTFSPERVYSEVGHILANARELHNFIFSESDILADPRRAEKIFGALGAFKGSCLFEFGANPLFLRDGPVRLLNGNIRLSLGVQSLVPEVLAKVCRGGDIGRVKANILKYEERLAAYTQTYGLSFIYGLPGDNHRNFLDAMEFALAHAPAKNFYRLMVFPNSYLGENKKALGLKSMPKPPYYALSNTTYTPGDMAKTGKLLSKLEPLITLSSRDSFVNGLLLRAAGLLPGKEHPNLFVYERTAEQLSRLPRPRALLKEACGFSTYSYRSGFGLEKRLRLWDAALGAAARTLAAAGKNGAAGRLEGYLSAARLRLIGMQDPSWAALAADIRARLSAARGKKLKTLVLPWSDYRADIPGAETQPLTDEHTDKTLRPAVDPVSLPDLPARLRGARYDLVIAPFILGSLGDAGKMRETLAAMARLAPGGYVLLIDDLGPGFANGPGRGFAAAEMERRLGTGALATAVKAYILKA